MRFFAEITVLNIVGIVLLVLGAVLTFASKKFAEKLEKPQRELAVKGIGLALVIAGFLMVIFGS